MIPTYFLPCGDGLARTHKLIKFPQFFANIYMLYCICGISIDICTDCCRLPNGFQELWAWQLPPSDDECWYFSWKSWRIMANREPPARYVINGVQWCVWLISFCGLFSTFLCDYFLFLFFFCQLLEKCNCSREVPTTIHSWSSLLVTFAWLFSRHFHIFHSPPSAVVYRSCCPLLDI